MTTRQNLQYAWNGFLDLIYPPRCLVCEKDGEAILCEACRGTFAPIDGPICAVCGRPETAGIPCRECERAVRSSLGGWGFDAARAAGIYQGAMREAIHLLKFSKQELLGEPLGAFLAERCLVDGLLTGEMRDGIHCVAPVPLHWTRQWKRGFNQARLLAKPLAEQMGLPLTTAVRRIQRTPKQSQTDADARRKNVTREKFDANVKAVAGRGILLVDDVFTTGTTVSVCAAALKAAGASKVIVVTLAAGG